MTDKLNENWRPIPGFEGAYSVSDQGRILSHRREILCQGRVHVLKERVVKTPLSVGYPCFNTSVNGVVTRHLVHQIVMRAFVGPVPAGHEVRHLDGNPTNNRLSNLAYGTRAQNIDDAKAHGTFPVFEDRPGAVLNRDQVMEIVKSPARAQTLAKKFSVLPNTIYSIRSGLAWSDLTGIKHRYSGYRIGELAPMAKLTANAVREIMASPLGTRAIATQYGVSNQTISMIRNGRSWNHVTGLKKPGLNPATSGPDPVVGG